MSKNVKWIARTGVLVALLVALQTVAALLSGRNQFITGSIVNMVLVVSVMSNGIATGLSVAAVSPIVATLLGIGPTWVLVPFIIAGNLILVLLWHVIGNRKTVNKYVAKIAALIVAAVSKFLVIYFFIIRIAIPYIPGVPNQAAVLFSYPQLITASIGGALAIGILTTLYDALKKN